MNKSGVFYNWDQRSRVHNWNDWCSVDSVDDWCSMDGFHNWHLVNSVDHWRWVRLDGSMAGYGVGVCGHKGSDHSSIGQSNAGNKGDDSEL